MQRSWWWPWETNCGRWKLAGVLVAPVVWGLVSFFCNSWQLAVGSWQVVIFCGLFWAVPSARFVDCQIAERGPQMARRGAKAFGATESCDADHCEGAKAAVFGCSQKKTIDEIHEIGIL